MEKTDECGADAESLRRGRAALAIFAVFLIIYSAYIGYYGNTPFLFDEGCYSIMITEFSANPAMVMPTVTGEHPEWKPPLFTWVYSAFYFFLKSLPFSVEMVFRLPSAFFGACTVSLVFLFGEKIYNYKAGLFSAGIYGLFPLVMFLSTLVMMETFSSFLVMAALCAFVYGKNRAAAILVGMLTLTKWLYVAPVLVFIAAYSWQKNKIMDALPAFLAVPAALAFWLLLAYFFGDFSHVSATLLFDLLRGITEKTGSGIINPANFRDGFGILMPLSAFFLAALAINWKYAKENLPVTLMAAPALLLPAAGQFIFWYVSPFLMGFAVFFGKMIEQVGEKKGATILLVMLLVTDFYLADYHGYGRYDTGIREAAELMKGEETLFVEPGPLFRNWKITTDQYMGTDAERLVLEQRNPGFLFYRFWNNRDYENLDIAFIDGLNGTYSPPCMGQMVVHARDRATSYNYSIEIPDCYDLIWKYGDYEVYGKEGRAGIWD